MPPDGAAASRPSTARRLTASSFGSSRLPGPSSGAARSRERQGLTLVSSADYDRPKSRTNGKTVQRANGSSNGSAKRNGSAASNGDGSSNGSKSRLKALTTTDPFTQVVYGDARTLPLPDDSVDLIVTSPPYWRKRDYGVEGQIGQEETPKEYVAAILECFKEWRRVLRPTGSVFFNVGDTYDKRSLAGVPSRIEAAVSDDGWMIRNRIVWTKEKGMPEAVTNRLTSRHEYIIHFTLDGDYYYDLFGYSERFGNGTNPGDVWHMIQERNMGKHLAPFPSELVERAIWLGCPEGVCTKCLTPKRRKTERTGELDTSRVQARRALELAKEANLTPAHIAAIQATGVSDAGKALKTQNGTGRNSREVQLLAAEAKEALGGYFREFTFAKRVQTGWDGCSHRAPLMPGVVLDPFMGTGTTLRVAESMGRSSVGVDLLPHW